MSTRNYEAMFILDHNAASEDFDGTSAVVDQILEKHGASVVQKEKWDERKLAYEIKGHRRGTYYLTYFTAEPTAIDNINEDVQLSETILRHMVIVLDRPIDEHIQVTADEREKLAEDSRKNSLGGWGGRRGSDRGGRSGGAPRRRDDDDDDDDSDRDDDRPAPRRAAAPEAKGAPASESKSDTASESKSAPASESKSDTASESKSDTASSNGDDSSDGDKTE